MDVFAHVLWTNVVYYKAYKNMVKDRLWAVFFGVIPDLVGFTPAFFYMLFLGQDFGPELFNSNVWVFKYASQAYNYTHSIVIFLVATLVVYAIRKGRVYWPMFGWLLHIVIDIFTHENFYLTPFLFPLSSYRFEHGISWGHPIFMAINYSCLAVAYIIIFVFLKKKNEKK